MKDDTGPTTPTIVSDDGWTLASGSSGGTTEAELLKALGKEPAPADEKPAKEAAPPPEEPAAEEPAAEEAAPVEATADEPETPVAPKARKRKAHDPQRRIDAMHAELAQERETRLRLEGELNALRGGRAPARPAAPVRPEPPKRPTLAPLPADALAQLGPRPVFGGEHGMEAAGKSYDEFEEARSEWDAKRTRLEIEHALNTRLEQEQQQTATARVREAADAAFLSRIEAMRAKRPDYDQVIENLGDLDSPFLKHLIYVSPDGPAIGLHLAEHPDQAETLARVRFSRPVMDSLTRSAAPAKLLDHFATHPEVLDQLHRMDPIAAIVHIGRLEARLDVDPSVTTAAASSVTRARPPLRTVSGGAPLSRSAQPAAPDDDLPFGPDYMLRENQRDAVRRDRNRWS